MKGKRLVILLLLATAAGAAWYVLSARSRASWSESAGGGGKVLEFPINDVARLKIRNATGELNLVKNADGWVVRERADYPASFQEVSDFVRRLWELRTGQEIKVGPSQMPRLELVEPGRGEKAGTLVEIGGADGRTLAALLVGKKYGAKSTGGSAMDVMDVAKGRYVKPLNGAQVSLVADSLDDAQPKPETWLLKEFLHITPAKSIAVLGPDADRSWTVTREKNTDAKWQVAGARPEEQPDSTKTFRLNRLFSASAILDVLAPDAASGLDHPTIAKIDTFDGFHYELKIGKASGESFPLHVSVTADLARKRTVGEDEKPDDQAKREGEFQTQQKRLAEKLSREQKFARRTFLVPKIEAEPLLKNRAELLADNPAAPAPAPAPAVSAPDAPAGPAPNPTEIPAVPAKEESPMPPSAAGS